MATTYPRVGSRRGRGAGAARLGRGVGQLAAAHRCPPSAIDPAYTQGPAPRVGPRGRRERGRNCLEPRRHGSAAISGCLQILYAKPVKPIEKAGPSFSPSVLLGYPSSGVPSAPRCGCWRKNRTISADASGPLGSVYEPGRFPPDQACPSPWIIHCSMIV
jgi:hypothetical protein